METKPRLPQFSTSLLLLSALAPVNGDDRIGYYVASGAGTAQVASCNYQTTASHRWSSVGTIGVCVETNDSSDSGTMTTNYYLGEACNGTSAFGHYLATADDGRSATVTVSFPCESPSALPSVSFIGCPEQIGLPPEARTVYAELPSGITAATDSVTSSRSRSSSTSTSNPTQTTTNTRNETSEGPGSPGGSSNTPVIVGAVVGSVGGIALILLAFFLGRRHAAKKRTTNTRNTTHQLHEPYEKPELEDTRAGAGVGANPAGANDATQQIAWSQAAWNTRQQLPQVSPPSELSSNHPAAHQLSAERGPYEFPGSYEYSYQRQQG
ncbi:hypothetical protein DL765_005521 [Monosporascus sp. GIB2]|nr:hypothetical protein DL765_005521 [Monosporascus sp. GIB2]